jgi:NAD-dependent dihydropyrimidine dehydrogenase PreA subunit
VPNALAQYQKKPPDFGGSYSFPSPVHPEPAAGYLRFLDVALLALALGLAAWLVLKSRNRKGVVLLSLCSVAYFGFFRKGCICAVGAIQNVVLCLVSPQYVMSLSVIAIFFLPLVATLLFGRVFCSGVCALGALQDLVLFRPLRVPVKLDRALRWLQYLYLGLAVFFAGWGLTLKLGAWHVKLGQRFLICDWDPFIPIFRRSGPFYMVAIGVAFVLAGMFIGRPYCRWLCPYGGILALASRVAWKNVRITPDKELDCGLCADSCPYGAIRDLRADRAFCVACTRCYAHCPRQKRLVALKAGPRKPTPAPAVPNAWEAVGRTWIGIVASLLMVLCAVWLLTVYVHAQRVIPVGKALVDSLKEQAKTDAEIQKILQPELNRQHDAAVARRLVYNRCGAILLISTAVWIAWLSWFRPKRGAGAGLPAKVLRFLEQPPPDKGPKKANNLKTSKNQSDDSAGVAP